ncbi:MAG: 30S ribosomal protein S27e [Thaumarchaeota archaeon]|nr:30S ribosomal protein S27e [Nitrososphaerota archaeon]
MRYRNLIPKPRSAFLLVKCKSCGNEQIVYSHTTIDIRCNVCGNLLAEHTGGKAKIYGKIVRRLD